MSHEIENLSHDTSITNAICGCRKYHRLHYAKEPIFKYQDQPWGLKCLLEVLVLKLSFNQGTTDDLGREVKTLQEEADYLKFKFRTFSGAFKSESLVVQKFMFHLEGCQKGEMLAVGRDGKLAKCTCGLDKAQENSKIVAMAEEFCCDIRTSRD